MAIDPSKVVWDDAPKIDPSKVQWDDESTTAPKSGGLVKELGRQLGLTGRALVEGNPYVALGDMFAEPIRVAGNYIRPGTFPQRGGEALADLLHLPKPQNKMEGVIQAYSQALAGSAGAPLLEKLAPRVVESARPAVEWLASNPKTQVDAALGATSGALLANEAGYGPNAQMAAALAGGMVGPGVSRAIRIGAEPFMDIGATIGAGFGNERGIRRIETDAIERGLGPEKGRVRAAMGAATEYVPGVKPTVAEAIAEANLKSPDQFGGFAVRLQKDLTGAKGVEDVLPTVGKQQRQAIRAENRQINVDLWPEGEKALKAVNANGGIRAVDLLGRIDQLLAVAKNQGSTLITRTLNATRKKIEGLVRENGTIDAEAAYSLRKELGNDIKGFQKETNNWDKTMSMGLEREIQKAIDDSIEGSGGVGWRENYLIPYAERKAAIGQQVARAKEAKRIGLEVKPTGGPNVAPGEVPKPPTLLIRTMMFANYGLRMLAHNANDPIIKDLTRRLSDPAAFAELLQRPDRDPLKIRAMEAIKRGQVAAALNQQNNGQLEQ